MQLHSFRRNDAETEFICLNCSLSATYCNRFEVKDCPAPCKVEQGNRILFAMQYGVSDPYKRVFGITASQSLDAIKRRVGAVDCTLIETPLRNEIKRLQGELTREQDEYKRIVSLRKDDLTNYEKHTNDMKHEIEKTKETAKLLSFSNRTNRKRADEFEKKIGVLDEVIKIERAHAAVLQTQFDIAIKQRDEAQGALTLSALLAKDVIASQQQTIANLRSDKPVLTPFFTLDDRLSVEEASRRLERFWHTVARFQKENEELKEEVRKSRMANVYTPDCATGAAKTESMSQADGYAAAAALPEMTGVSVKNYPGVIWATHEALNAQKHGASVEDAQAYLDFCETHSLLGPYYGFQQWKAIYRAASGKVA